LIRAKLFLTIIKVHIHKNFVFVIKIELMNSQEQHAFFSLPPFC